uniref:UDENN domain-containing protein n=2 Tax=Macrostomum lignano TaxID=282301 RepID=A0A1I8INI3_9PLAT
MNRHSFSDKKFLSWSEVEAGRMRARLQWRRRPLGEVELPDSVPTELEESEMAATAAASVSSCLSIHCQNSAVTMPLEAAWCRLAIGFNNHHQFCRDAQAAGRISSAEDQPIVGYRLALHQTSPGSISLTTPEVPTDSPKEESPLLSHSPQAATTSVIRERRRERRLFQSGNATVAAPSAAAPSNSASLQQLPPPSPTSQQQPPPKPRSRCIGKPLNTSTAAPSTAEVQHTGQQTESRYKFPDALFHGRLNSAFKLPDNVVFVGVHPGAQQGVALLYEPGRVLAARLAARGLLGAQRGAVDQRVQAFLSPLQLAALFADQVLRCQIAQPHVLQLRLLSLQSRRLRGLLPLPGCGQLFKAAAQLLLVLLLGPLCLLQTALQLAFLQLDWASGLRTRIGCVVAGRLRGGDLLFQLAAAGPLQLDALLTVGLHPVGRVLQLLESGVVPALRMRLLRLSRPLPVISAIFSVRLSIFGFSV